ncbi:MAG: ATPase, partial [Nitrospinaceae bacterium]
MKDDVRGSEIHSQKVTIGGVQLTLSQPDTSEVTWIGQSEILKQVLACWLVVGEKDLPLAPRSTG